MIKKNINSNLYIENTIICLYCLFLIISVFNISMFHVPNAILSIKNILILVIPFISFVFTKHTMESYILSFIGVAITLIGLILDNRNTPYYLFMVLTFFSMSNISAKKFLKYTALACALALFVIFISSLLGIIPNLLFVRNGKIRQSFGTIYPLTFGSYIFYICSALGLVVSNKKNCQWVSLFLIFIAILLNSTTGARSDVIALIGVAIVILLKKITLPNIFGKIVNLLAIIICGLGVCSVYITKFIPYLSPLYISLDKLFSGRLQMQSTLLEYYSPKWFGQYIFQVGNGGYEGLDPNRIFYFFIDNSFTRLIFVAGILFTIYYLFLLIRRIWILDKNGYVILSLVFLIICFNGLTEDSMINIGVNLFCPLMLMGESSFEENF